MVRDSRVIIRILEEIEKGSRTLGGVTLMEVNTMLNNAQQILKEGYNKDNSQPTQQTTFQERIHATVDN